MIRDKLKQKSIDQSTQFRFRGVDNTRIEAYSDGVFAIATALLIISTSVPQTYNELLVFIDDLVPFAACITLLIMIWYEHYIFFLRYGFKDPAIVAVNTLFLFLVLFFIYPLKFLFSLLFKMIQAGIAGDNAQFRALFTDVISMKDAPSLMIIYGIGAMAVYFTMAWMYFIAYRRRHKIDLNSIETFDTKSNVITNLVMGSVPIVSMSLVVIIDHPAIAFKYSGLTYMSYAVIMPVVGGILGKKRNALIASQATEASADISE